MVRGKSGLEPRSAALQGGLVGRAETLDEIVDRVLPAMPDVGQRHAADFIPIAFHGMEADKRNGLDAGPDVIARPTRRDGRSPTDCAVLRVEPTQDQTRRVDAELAYAREDTHARPGI